MSDLKTQINEACRARANLHVLYGIIGTLENGTISGESAAKTAMKIIRLCKEEAREQLRKMDAAIEAAHGIKGDAA